MTPRSRRVLPLVLGALTVLFFAQTGYAYMSPDEVFGPVGGGTSTESVAAPVPSVTTDLPPVPVEEIAPDQPDNIPQEENIAETPEHDAAPKGTFNIGANIHTILIVAAGICTGAFLFLRRLRRNEVTAPSNAL